MTEPRRAGGKGPRGRTANIFDVARLAGVSHQTVSRVINDLPNVRPATRARVEQAIAQLQYSPSPAARALVTRRTRTIGLVTPGISDYGPTSIAMHFNFAARAARYNVESVSAPSDDPKGIRAVVDGLLRQRVDALVLVVDDVAVLELVASLDLRIPVVAVGVHRPPEPADRLHRPVPRRAGRRTPPGRARAHAHPAPRGTADRAGRDRARPRLARRARGPPARDRGAASSATGRPPAATGSGSELDVEPGDAVFVGNDHMSIGLLSALRERGLRVPEDVSVVGFDDVPEAGYLVPPLTTVRQDFGTLGEIIMQKVLIAVEEPDTATEDTPLPTHLILRQSTRPTPSA